MLHPVTCHLTPSRFYWKAQHLQEAPNKALMVLSSSLHTMRHDLKLLNEVAANLRRNPEETLQQADNVSMYTVTRGGRIVNVSLAETVMIKVRFDDVP